MNGNIYMEAVKAACEKMGIKKWQPERKEPEFPKMTKEMADRIAKLIIR